MQRQAVQHALARYWILFLQDKNYLANVYNTYRTRDIRQTTTDPVDDAKRLIFTATAKDLATLEADFNTWFDELNRPITNEDVAEIQRRLTSLGYSPGKDDGLLGVNTIRAVKQFQLDNGLSADGQVNTDLIGLIKSKTGR